MSVFLWFAVEWDHCAGCHGRRERGKDSELLTLWGHFAYRHGAQNAHDSASKQTLENEFGTSNEDECMVKILEGGTLQESEVRSYAFVSLLSKLTPGVLDFFFGGRGGPRERVSLFLFTMLCVRGGV